MPLRNRVRPDGEIVATSQRGMLFGNRGGKIHDPLTKRLTNRRWASKRWICCVTEFKNRQRHVMGNGYTELFFLDEVTALASGHRPCFECRRKDAENFAALWQQTHGFKKGSRADQMDKLLHAQRCSGDRSPLIIPFDSCREAIVYCQRDQFYVRKGARWLKWQFSGYAEDSPSISDELIQITPPAIADIIGRGFAPHWHPSANSG